MPDDAILSSLRRHVFEPLFTWKSASPLRSYWSELEKSQFHPEQVLRERQWRRLRELIGFVWDNNDFYRSRLQAAQLDPSAIRTPDDLGALPVLTKEEVRKNTPDMISRGYDLKQLMHFKTGGSTGKSLDLYLSEECSERRNACARRHDRWTGWEVGEPIAAVWGNPHLPSTFKEKLRHHLVAPYLFLDTMNLNEDAVRVFEREWGRVRPTLLFGHAHSIYLLARYVRSLGLEGIRPKGILSTSMMLMPHERRFIESVFGVKVTNRYGCEEVSLIASECEKHDGMHLNVEHLYIEFLKDDGTPAAAGESGKIVVTDLMNYAMPLIRYRVEDVGVYTDRKCSCGRGLPLMEDVAGRVADFIIRRDGSKVAGISLIENTLTKLPGIDQMQIIQEAMDDLQVRVVPGESFNDQVAAELVQYFKTLLGDTAKVRVETVPCIEPEPSGKYRFSICKVPSP